MNNRVPEVSIGLPVFQGEQFLQETVESLLNQTFRDFELIICDNASTDGTERICRAFAAADPRVRYYRNETNIGPFKNYWRVFELARAPYFKWNSANDLCDPPLLEECLKALKSHPDAVLAYMKTKLVDDDLILLEEFDDRMDIQDERPSDRFISFVTKFRLANALSGVMRSEALRQVRPFGEFRASDIVFMGELVMVGKFVEVPKFGFLRRVGKQTSTTHRDSDALRKFYFPGARRRRQLVWWRLSIEYFRAILHATLPLKERLRLLWFELRAFHWNRQALRKELWGYMSLSEETPEAGQGSTKISPGIDNKQLANKSKGWAK